MKLKEYIAQEGKTKRSMVSKIHRSTSGTAEAIPMQRNFVDCGIYALEYFKKFINDPKEFTRKLLMGRMDAQEDWPELDSSLLRRELRELCQKLYKEQEEVRAEQRRLKLGARSKVAGHSKKPEQAVSSTRDKDVSPVAVENTLDDDGTAHKYPSGTAEAVTKQTVADRIGTRQSASPCTPLLLANESGSAASVERSDPQDDEDISKPNLLVAPDALQGIPEASEALNEKQPEKSSFTHKPSDVLDKASPEVAALDAASLTEGKTSGFGSIDPVFVNSQDSGTLFDDDNKKDEFHVRHHHSSPAAAIDETPTPERQLGSDHPELENRTIFEDLNRLSAATDTPKPQPAKVRLKSNSPTAIRTPRPSGRKRRGGMPPKQVPGPDDSIIEID
ncbi:hypothetical protein EJ05DRAFT_133813 [Pseudovirgaria hyperparasitica]|uniref:Ubiquitin-like protease family profile domain-containing protein n=1 Tax=Pseudovirgaria hyperparasitica TaxID=470096 RepID=A0A6A6VZP3_9PEZI|nr:uncharacterized protein EJ05DRAFT_133813 [Pseudovirgaria hyperparasitica]KAF2754797.1 hypothetical protein EJ05DRAFT_133813 [Pseudovirgaria hyperparasitica]